MPPPTLRRSLLTQCCLPSCSRVLEPLLLPSFPKVFGLLVIDTSSQIWRLTKLVGQSSIFSFYHTSLLHRFPSAAYLVAWVGLAPGNCESADKQLSGKTFGKGRKPFLHKKDVASLTSLRLKSARILGRCYEGG